MSQLLLKVKLMSNSFSFISDLGGFSLPSPDNVQISVESTPQQMMNLGTVFK